MNNGSSGYSYTELKQLVEYMEMLEKENDRHRKENEELNEENEDLNKENEQLNRENGMLQNEVRKWREQWKMNQEYL